MERRRSGWDVVLGILLVVGGLVVLGDVVLASVVSLFFIAWSALIAGVVLLIDALTKLRSGGAVWPAIGGAVLLVFFNPLTASLTLLGVMLGIQILIDGLTLIMAGRLHPTAVPATV